MAAAAVILMLLTVFRPGSQETADATALQRIAAAESVTAAQEAIPISEKQEMATTAQIDAVGFAGKSTPNNKLAVFQHTEKENDTGAAENNEEAQTEKDKPMITSEIKEKPKSNISSVKERPEENKIAAKKDKKWLLAAAFGTVGHTNDFRKDYNNASSELNLNGSGNKYAVNATLPGYTSTKGITNGTEDMQSSLELSLNGSSNRYAASTVPLSHISAKDITNIRHTPPFSLGMMARKSLGKRSSVESGVVYTCLASRFKWSDYDVNQRLHYMGIPVNMVVSLGSNAKSDWQIYLSGGFTVEKGLRAICRHERQMGNMIHTITSKRSIDGLQWSLNGALGVNYRFYKGLGIYFEPRAGYSFDCNQPVSIRTERPVYIGINLGLNYEL